MHHSQGYVIIHLHTCPSTNDELKTRVANEKAGHGTVITAGYQSNGRGQGGNLWESEDGKNILMSVNLDTHLLKAEEQAYFNFAVSLGVADMVKEHFPGRVKIKWPNDIYLDHKKVAGILIENTLQGDRLKNSVTGIGVNINQAIFSNMLATSFALAGGKEYDVTECLHLLLQKIKYRYDELGMMLRMKLAGEYHDMLYKREEEAFFSVQNKRVMGVIKGVDEQGRLKIMIDGMIRHYNRQEISHLFS